MERVLVTGCWGFVGRTLVPTLAHEGFEVWGLDKRSSKESFPGKKFLEADLGDGNKIIKLLSDINPDFIIHLAAQSSAGRSFDEPLRTINNNVLPTLYILEAMRLGTVTARLLAIGSADEYGPADPDSLPLDEERQPNPVNPYALSKVIQNRCCRIYASLYGVEVVITRSFNHAGPWQSDTFVLPSFAKQVVEIRHGLREPLLQVGDLGIKRDFLDVRDVVRAYLLLLRKGSSGEVYNVCSARAYSLEELLSSLCEMAGVKPDIKVLQSKMRPVDTRALAGNNRKITKDTGWLPRIPMDETLKSLLDYWEHVVGKSENLNID